MEEQQLDWQISCREIKARGGLLLENEKWADCRFLVGTEPNQQILSGHKLILAMASPVFERMFYGNLPDKLDPIPIPDVQPDAFRAMLEYIYSDKINITSFDKACELCYVAKKYLLPFVVEQCTNYLWADLCPKNACRAYEFAKLFEEPRLMQRCIDIISTKTREVLADPNIMDVELSTLLVIFDQERLNIESELDLFNALHKYVTGRDYLSKKTEDATYEVAMEPQVDVVSMQDGMEPEAHGSASIDDSCLQFDPTDKGHVMIKEALKKIRFLTLNPQQFAEGPARSKLLSQAEALSILINISSPNVSDCPLPEGFSAIRVCRNRMPTNDDIFDPELVYDDQPRPQRWNGQISRIPDAVSMDFRSDQRKCYCIRSIRHEYDYRNTNVFECELSFKVNKNILITGVQVPTQVLIGELMSSAGFTDRYCEQLYTHLLDAQGSRLSYTHCTARVRYDSLLEISFDHPVSIQRLKHYKIEVSLHKHGYYPIYSCYPAVSCYDNVDFEFNVEGTPAPERNGLIRSIVFLNPIVSPQVPQVSNYLMMD